MDVHWSGTPIGGPLEEVIACVYFRPGGHNEEREKTKGEHRQTTIGLAKLDAAVGPAAELVPAGAGTALYRHARCARSAAPGRLCRPRPGLWSRVPQPAALSPLPAGPLYRDGHRSHPDAAGPANAGDCAG